MIDARDGSINNGHLCWIRPPPGRRTIGKKDLEEGAEVLYHELTLIISAIHQVTRLWQENEKNLNTFHPFFARNLAKREIQPRLKGAEPPRKADATFRLRDIIGLELILQNFM